MFLAGNFFFCLEMSTKIKFIGNYDVSAEGKFLWEILCQLRSLGVGRIVTKNEWMRKWPKQPSYLRIVKVCYYCFRYSSSIFIMIYNQLLYSCFFLVCAT